MFLVFTRGFQHCVVADTADGWTWVPVAYSTLGEAVARARMLAQGSVVADGAEVWSWEEATRSDHATLMDWLAETRS